VYYSWAPTDRPTGQAEAAAAAAASEAVIQSVGCRGRASPRFHSADISVARLREMSPVELFLN